MFSKLFGQKDLFGQAGLRGAEGQAQHASYVNAFYKIADPARLKLTLDARATRLPRCEIYQETAPTAPPGLGDPFHDRVPLRFWRRALLLDPRGHGAALLAPHEGLGAAPLRRPGGTSPQNKGKNYSDPADWPVICRSGAREQGLRPDRHPQADELGEFDGADAVKSGAWSSSCRPAPREIHRVPHGAEGIGRRQAGRGLIVEAALKKTWGWTINDLDYR
jgi:hypothetical protein